MKKIISLLLAAVMLIGMMGILAGCNQGGNKVAPDFVMPEGGLDTTNEITITFYHSMGKNLTAILETAIADFNKIYPNIFIEHKYIGNYDAVRDQIKTEISVGDQPNLAYCYPDHVALYNVAGAVQTLDVLINDPTYGFTAEQIADFVPAYYNEGKSLGDGKMYTLPISKSTEVLYYNKTFFEANSLTVPTTWEEMEAVCKQIKTIDSTCIPLGYDSEANWFITMCEQYGSEYTSTDGENFRFDNETNRNFVKKFQEWYAQKLVTTGELCGGYTSDLFKGSDKNGTRSYMCIGSTGGATYQQPTQTNGVFEFEVGITSIPQVNPENPKVISQGPSVCIFKNADPQEVLASWLFAKFLTTDINFQAGFSMSNGYAPVIQSIQENEVYANFLSSYSTANIQAYAVKVAVEQSNAYFVSPAFNGSSDAREQVGLLMQRCIALTGSDLDSAIKKAFEEAVAECKYQAGQ
ncbi:MAG: extracellular solute-binding protein [Ruminococcaceae bacterium]|nr:extracellular solute-binding protein [Oscillospiraceae bacterium]